jgi:hypothetical protein
MNKKVILVIVLMLGALVMLVLFSFGPLAKNRKKFSVNPASMQPSTSNIVNSTNKQVSFNLYSNKDMKENYYGISLPKDWQVKSGGAAGSYDISYSQGTGSTILQDISDNTTLELYVLSQEEPRLKKTVPQYVKQDYKKVAINGNEAHEIIYTSTENSKALKTIKVYIAGADHAGLITFSADASGFETLLPLFMQSINSFNWQNI